MAGAHIAAGPAPALDVTTLDESQKNIRRKVHETIAKVSDDFGRRQTFNTAIAAVMELCNELGKLGDDQAGRALMDEALHAIVLMLSPIVPHTCHALWTGLGEREDILNAPWPGVDDSALARDSIEIVVQVNGKVRARMEVPAAADKQTIETLAQSQPNVSRFLEGQSVRKIIVVPGKLVNIVATS